jgi:hydroxyacylglutathione hydrolase
MEVRVFPKTQFTSNTYLLEKALFEEAYLIDVGEYQDSRDFLIEKRLQIKALFLTHGHYDHIYGIRELLCDFPKCCIYAHEYTLQSLLDPKLNLSFYHEDPVFLLNKTGIPIQQGFKFEIFPKVVLESHYTPGHNIGSMCYTVSDFLFTGDSYIPYMPVVTKLKGGNKEQSNKSLQSIKSLIKPSTKVAAGHGPLHLGIDLLHKDALLVV